MSSPHRPKTYVTRRLEWCSAHRLLRHESKCASLHGHRYAAEITYAADQLDGVDRVIDFGVIKETVGNWIDQNWDHTTFVFSADEHLRTFLEAERARGKKAHYLFSGETTTENIAHELLRVAQDLNKANLPRVQIVSVRVYESDGTFAEVRSNLSSPT